MRPPLLLHLCHSLPDPALLDAAPVKNPSWGNPFCHGCDGSDICRSILSSSMGGPALPRLGIPDLCPKAEKSGGHGKKKEKFAADTLRSASINEFRL